MKLVIIPSTLRLHFTCEMDKVDSKKLTQALASKAHLVTGDSLLNEIDELLMRQKINRSFIKQINFLVSDERVELIETSKGFAVEISSSIQVGVPKDLALSEEFLVDIFISESVPVFKNDSAISKAILSRLNVRDVSQIIGLESIDVVVSESAQSEYFTSVVTGTLIDVSIDEFDDAGNVTGKRVVQVSAEAVSKLLSDSSIMMQYMAKAHMTNDAAMDATRSFKTGLVENGLLKSL